MTSLSVGFVLVLVIPVILASWRTSLIGLSLQGLLMGWMVLEEGRAPSLPELLLLLDLLVVRGLVVPIALYRTLRPRQTRRRNDVLPANLFSWALGGAALFLALRFGRVLGGTDLHLSAQMFVGTSAFLLGLLVLGTQTAPFSQIVGLLRVENAVALFELTAPEPPPLPIQVGLLVIYLLTALTLTGFLRSLTAEKPPPPEEQTL